MYYFEMFVKKVKRNKYENNYQNNFFIWRTLRLASNELSKIRQIIYKGIEFNIYYKY